MGFYTSLKLFLMKIFQVRVTLWIIEYSKKISNNLIFNGQLLFNKSEYSIIWIYLILFTVKYKSFNYSFSYSYII